MKSACIFIIIFMQILTLYKFVIKCILKISLIWMNLLFLLLKKINNILIPKCINQTLDHAGWVLLSQENQNRYFSELTLLFYCS